MRFLGVTLGAGLVLAIATPAFAHFKLVTPDGAYAQNMSTGDPQMTAPCGTTTSPTGLVTQFETGQVIMVQITETIAHPGHYRVALAQDEASLPADPVTTGTMCNSADIQSPPSLPLLADGALVHTGTLSPTTQSIQITLPAGMTCTNCVMQVIEFTANHTPPCFHYHCAMVTIANTPPPADAGVDGNGMMMPDDAATGADGGGGGNDDGGTGSAALTNPYANQGCSTSGGSTGLVALALALLIRRRRTPRT